MLARLKFDITDLVNEILDSMPEDVIINGKVLDPAMGGGQFVKEIERRKRLAGKTDQEINETVFGYEENILRRDYVVNKYELKGKYIVDNFLERDFKDMKFDVIVGNPPYQDKNQGLWQEFTKKSIKLLKTNGIISFVTPNSWANGSNLNSEKNIFNSIFQKYRCIKIHTNVNNHFKGIGKNIGYWIIKKELTPGNAIVVDKDGISKNIDISMFPFFLNVFSFDGLEIFKKIIQHNSFYSNFVEKSTQSKRYYAFPKIRHNAGYRKGYRYDNLDVNFPTSPVVVGFDCTDKTLDQVKSIHSQFESTTFKFLWKIYGADDAGSFGWILRNMPKLPDNKIYTDTDVYKYFNFSKKDIEFIESNVK